MLKICKKIVIWFVVFVLSYLIESVARIEQGKAFVYIHIIVMMMVACVLLMGRGLDYYLKNNKEYFIVAVYTVVICAVEILATWGATQIFNIDFCVAYQIMTFGQCLRINVNKKTK